MISHAIFGAPGRSLPTDDGAAVPLEGDDLGDPFEQVYREHYRRLVGVIRLSGARPEVAEDIAQEAFARTFGRWATVRGGSNPAGYVYRTAFRLVRRERLQQRVSGTSVDQRSASVSDADHATRLAVLDALAHLPGRQRACVLLNLYADLSSEQVGVILRIKPSTVRVHVARARAALREVMANE